MVWQGKEELWFDNIGAEGQVFLTLGQGEGDSVAQLIMNQVEESQMIERLNEFFITQFRIQYEYVTLVVDAGYQSLRTYSYSYCILGFIYYTKCHHMKYYDIN